MTFSYLTGGGGFSSRFDTLQSPRSVDGGAASSNAAASTSQPAPSSSPLYDEAVAGVFFSHGFAAASSVIVQRPQLRLAFPRLSPPCLAPFSTSQHPECHCSPWPTPNSCHPAFPVPAAGAMRLGLRLEQRSDVRRLVDGLTRRLAAAGEDLAAAVGRVDDLSARNAALEGVVRELREQLQLEAARPAAQVRAAQPLPCTLRQYLRD